ncbi:hypothetical protein P5673_016216 [Acropora cervicornis]|uniref:Uncharacterized protein n=1 Tax=Acropora cervicornis TaxID=6130 RepID=A0AAD9V4L6_ACRCE|nr:hypothetical protein P5673_016216 [Acropora cervicornis]
MVINIPADCNHACEENAKQAFQLLNNALHVNTKKYNNYPSAQLNKVDNVIMRVQTIIVSETQHISPVTKALGTLGKHDVQVSNGYLYILKPLLSPAGSVASYDASELSSSCDVSSTCMHRKQINGVPVAITPPRSYCDSSTSQSWLKVSSSVVLKPIYRWTKLKFPVKVPVIPTI